MGDATEYRLDAVANWRKSVSVVEKPKKPHAPSTQKASVVNSKSANQGAFCPLISKSIVTIMKKFIKNADKKFLAGFIPLSAASLYLTDFSAAALGAVLFGAAYLVWQVIQDAKRR